jgi:hypothetical protein
MSTKSGGQDKSGGTACTYASKTTRILTALQNKDGAAQGEKPVDYNRLDGATRACSDE